MYLVKYRNKEYALKQLDKTEFKDFSNQILNIFKTTDALTKAYILKKIPSDVLTEHKISIQLYNTFPEIDINSRTLLIQKMESANPNAVEILSKYLNYMTKNQLKLYLKFIEETPESLTREVKSNLIKASNYKGYIYNHLIKEFLKNRK